MIVSAGLVKTYPRMAIWICDNLPKVRDNPKVFAAFQKYASLDEKVAERAIKHGSPPVIEFRHMPTSNGEYHGSKYPGIVFLSKDICDKFQGSTMDANDPRMHLLVQATLLHEMVHWGDWMDGEVTAGELGKSFEKEAYGKDIRRYW